MSKEITEETLFNYFDNKATTLEKKRIDEWVKAPENEELFYKYLTQWESKNLQYVSDVEAAIERHQNRLRTSKQTDLENNQETRGAQKRLSLKWLVAASLLIGVILGGYFSKDQVLYKTLATSYGQTKSVLLDDGTRVVLNSNSALTIPRFGFGDYTRRVSLKGEADFSVKHLPGDQKFIVKTPGADVVVLGTEFTVYTRPHGTKVVLSKGKIQLNYNEKNKSKNLIMHPGELVTIDAKGNAVMKKTANPEAFSAWKEHRYVFDHTSLQDLCTLFEENFGLKIEMTDHEISTWTLSGAFKASDAEELLEALSESSGLVYKKENQKVIILSLRNRSNP